MLGDPRNANSSASARVLTAIIWMVVSKASSVSTSTRRCRATM